MFWSRITQITAQDVKALIDQEDVLVIDVRQPKDCELSHIDGVIFGDKESIHQQIEPTRQSSPIICYCYTGFSSKTACPNLTNAGFSRVLNLKDGYAAWQKAFPTKKD
ncbi:MAG: rhodanese-like domain-containing protein [Opitutales bacterium]|nr:rhodanese-like domain-containing protein [Opitutales bacterium]